MTISRGYTSDDIRAFVAEYDIIPFGKKLQWVEQQSFTKWQLYRWMRAILSGDLDRGLIPRENGTMSIPSCRKNRSEALAPNRDKDLAAQLAAKEKELAAKDVEINRQAEQIHRLEEATDALGKAIGLLHDRDVHESAPSQSTAIPRPKSS